MPVLFFMAGILWTIFLLRITPLRKFLFQPDSPDFFFTPIGLFVGTIIVSIEGGVGGLIAYKIFIRIKDTSIIKRIQKSF